MQYKRSGFTLIELLVTIAFIVILAGIIISCVGCGGGGGQKDEGNANGDGNNGGSTPQSPYPPDLGLYGSAPDTSSDLYVIAPGKIEEKPYIAKVGMKVAVLGVQDRIYLSNYGFQIYNGHAGGYGDTLEMFNSSCGIYLYWAGDSLQNISLLEGWQGQIMAGINQPTGIRLGGSASDFLAKFPQANVAEGNGYGGKSYCALFERELSNGFPSYRLMVDCDRNGMIKRIRADIASPGHDSEFLLAPGPK